MPFSLNSYLLGVGTVVGALAFGFGGGVMLTHTAMKETPAGPTRVEQVAHAEQVPSPQASSTQAAAQATVPMQVTDQAAAVTTGQATTPDPVPAAQAETPKPDATGKALPDASAKTETPRQLEPAKQAAKEPQPPNQVEPTERAEPKPAGSREATDRKAERAKRYSERRPREIAARRTKQRIEVQEEPAPEVVVSRPPEQHFDLFGGLFGRPADQDD
jgi:hypothetical protein